MPGIERTRVSRNGECNSMIRRWNSKAGRAARGFRRAALGIMVLAPLPASAASIEANYDISLLGLKIGIAAIKADVVKDQYKLDVWSQLTGLAGIITGGKGAATSTGSISGDRILPATFAVTTANSEKSITVRMALAGGSVQAVEIKPPIEPRPDRIPVTEQNKRGVVDPLSALLMPASSGNTSNAAACDRNIPVFDGATRFDVKLSYAREETVRSATYSGPVAVCRARYLPISGHRADRTATKFMENNKDMEAWLMPVGEDRVFIPYRISVRTPLGTTVIEATRVNVNGNNPRMPVRARN
ncbi:conserved hypothetical protein [Chelatococcus asaccharovorans]|nr:conserved hypothetical protein [Chelatococcus asaccharovorans]CAH1684225.1 conserved hypothetical protein [Chelatococcus asaccharovorans]